MSGAERSVILCTAGYDHTIRFWEAPTGMCHRTLQYADSVSYQPHTNSTAQLLPAPSHEAPHRLSLIPYPPVILLRRCLCVLRVAGEPSGDHSRQAVLGRGRQPSHPAVRHPLHAARPHGAVRWPHQQRNSDRIPKRQKMVNKQHPATRHPTHPLHDTRTHLVLTASACHPSPSFQDVLVVRGRQH